MSISLVKTSGAWFDVYNEQGEQVRSLSQMNDGDLIGWSQNFLITKFGDRYQIYDDTGYCRCYFYDYDFGTVEYVTGNTFIARKDGKTTTYSADEFMKCGGFVRPYML